MKDIQDNDLKAFSEWYKQRFNECCMPESVLATCMCGYFHTHAKHAEELLMRMQSLGLIIRHKNDTISITTEGLGFRPFGMEW